MNGGAPALTQERLAEMPAIEGRDDYRERLLRDRPEWAGRPMSDGTCTMLEHWFEMDCVQLPVAAQRYYREIGA